MASPADVERIRAANRGIVALVVGDLDRFWAALDLTRPAQARDALLEYLPHVVTAYGEAAATVAADWYDELRAAGNVPAGFGATMADVVPAELVQAQVRFGAQHLWTDRPTLARDFLMGAVQKYVLQPGRDTITGSAARDPYASGWRRVARADGCDFCRMLAGRGGVYKESTVRFASHGDCNCAAVPEWDPHAPEVDVMAYVASQRTSGMGPAQREAHNARVRDWIANNL